MLPMPPGPARISPASASPRSRSMRHALNQFDPSVMLPAADLLADAKVDAMAWNGTSASWLGIERDQEPLRGHHGAHRKTGDDLDARLHRRRPVAWSAACRPCLALYRRRAAAHRRCLGRRGRCLHAERHLGLRDNFSFGEVAPAEIADMIRAVAAEGCDAVVILCTNLDGAAVAAALEHELDIFILDSSRSRCGERCCSRVPTRRVLSRWGRIFQVSSSCRS